MIFSNIFERNRSCIKFQSTGKRFSNSQVQDIRAFYIVYLETELNSLCCIGDGIVVLFSEVVHTVPLLWFSSLHTILHIVDLTLKVCVLWCYCIGIGFCRLLLGFYFRRDVFIMS